MGVPQYATHNYNYIAMAFWLCKTGPADMAKVWDDPLRYMGASELGSTNNDIRANMLASYHSKGVKVLISAFGATEFPTTLGLDAMQCADSLADFIIKTGVDGVDIDYEDSAAFERGDGSGEQWLITLTQQLRKRLPSSIITHAPQAPYFMGATKYPALAYLKVNQVVGS